MLSLHHVRKGRQLVYISNSIVDHWVHNNTCSLFFDWNKNMAYKKARSSTSRISTQSAGKKNQSTENAGNAGGRILHFFHTVLDFTDFSLL